MSDGRYRAKNRAARTAQMESAGQFSPGDKVNVRTEDGEILGTAVVGLGGTLRFAMPVNATVGGMVCLERMR